MALRGLRAGEERDARETLWGAGLWRGTWRWDMEGRRSGENTKQQARREDRVGSICCRAVSRRLPRRVAALPGPPAQGGIALSSCHLSLQFLRPELGDRAAESPHQRGPARHLSLSLTTATH